MCVCVSEDLLGVPGEQCSLTANNLLGTGLNGLNVLMIHAHYSSVCMKLTGQIASLYV